MLNSTELRSRLRQQPLILDGGMATTLEKRGQDLTGQLWSARLMLDAPEAIAQVQKEFLHAGSQVVTTATYQASYRALSEAGYGVLAADAIFTEAAKQACSLADRWQAETGTRPLVVGSVGPFGASLHDGSEYRGDYRLTVAELRAFHRRRLGILAEYVDVIAVETVPQLTETEAILAELEQQQVTAWLSFATEPVVDAQHPGLPNGEALAEAWHMGESSAQVVAVGVNCLAPSHAVAVLDSLSSSLPIVVYPNSGESWQDSWQGQGDINEYWSQLLRPPVGIIGGCCRTTPADIDQLAQLI